MLQVTDQIARQFKLILKLLLKSLNSGDGLLKLKLLHDLLLEYLLLNASTFKKSIKLDLLLTSDTYFVCLVARQVAERLGAFCPH